MTITTKHDNSKQSQEPTGSGSEEHRPLESATLVTPSSSAYDVSPQDSQPASKEMENANEDYEVSMRKPAYEEFGEVIEEFGEVIDFEDTNNEEEGGARMYSLRRFRQTCGQIVNHNHVQSVIVILIIINALIMGVATFDFVTDDEAMSRKFEKVDRTFLIIFTIELAFQIVYRGFRLFQDSWLTFDFVIVVSSWALESLQIIRAFRVFRVFRLITRVKPLRDLVTAIGSVMPRLYAITALSILVIYIYAVLFTELFSDLDLSSKYFTTLDASLFTCVELMSLEWVNPVREVMSHKDWAWFPFISYLMLMGFIMFNLILAVVCDAVSIVEENSRKSVRIEIDINTIYWGTHGRITELGDDMSKMSEEHVEMQKMIQQLGSALALPDKENQQAKNNTAKTTAVGL
mmetsp:Transcript_147/g.224  ORF Transcript_147/g.224 Transcript_147/m.224 type:complete len:404 (-) Transcript_147:1234-2445(-)